MNIQSLHFMVFNETNFFEEYTKFVFHLVMTLQLHLPIISTLNQDDLFLKGFRLISYWGKVVDVNGSSFHCFYL